MSAVKKIVHEAIDQMDAPQRELVLAWSEKAHEIATSTDLTKAAKLKALSRLETTPAVKAFIMALLAALKQHAWDERSWPARGALFGLAAGAATFGTQSAGIAAFGGAVGINLFLLTTAGGSLLATIISEISSASKKSDKSDK